MSLLPFTPESRQTLSQQSQRRSACVRKGRHSETKHSESQYYREERGEHKGRGGDHGADNSAVANIESEEPHRTVEVKVLSATHGHIVAILKVLVCPRPFILTRTLRFLEPENSIMKRRIHVLGHENMSMYPGEYSTSAKYVHCVEADGATTSAIGERTGSGTYGSEQSRVVVEWGPSGEHFSGEGSLDMLLRYRCGAFPSTGTFYLLIYNDPYQCDLHEVWQVVVQTRQRLDIHGSVGGAATADLVVRGDKYPRRARAFAMPSPHDIVSFKPDTVFQLVPGAYNRVALNVHSKVAGYRNIQLNLVDADSRELINGWLLMISATSPAIMRSYDVDVPVGKPLHKKIIFKNPWDVPRKFHLASSDDTLMKPRNPVVDVAAHGSAYLRLIFSGLALSDLSSSSTPANAANTREVHLFLNDANGGQNEECYLFRIRESLDF